ncbi:unnamed protein product [Prunus armeniaca]
MSSPNTRAKGSSSSRSHAYLSGDGVDDHPIEEDAEAPLCFQSSTALSFHTWLSKNLSHSYPSGEVRNNVVRWSDWIDRLLPRHKAYWKRAGIHDAILMSKNFVNKDENLLAAASCFWNSASNTFDFRLGPMTLTLLDLAQIFGFRPHGRPADACSFSPTAPMQFCWNTSTWQKPCIIMLMWDLAPQFRLTFESSSPPSKAKRLRNRAVNESEGKEEPAAVLTETTETDEELREAIEAEEIPAEIIAESIELAKKQQENQRAEPTSSELALFDDVDAEHSVAIPASEVEEGRTAGTLVVVTSPLKPPIVAMPIHSIPSSPVTASFAEEFEAMDLDAQLDKLE